LFLISKIETKLEIIPIEEYKKIKVKMKHRNGIYLIINSVTFYYFAIIVFRL